MKYLIIDEYGDAYQTDELTSTLKDEHENGVTSIFRNTSHGYEELLNAELDMWSPVRKYINSAEEGPQT